MENKRYYSAIPFYGISADKWMKVKADEVKELYKLRNDIENYDKVFESSKTQERLKECYYRQEEWEKMYTLERNILWMEAFGSSEDSSWNTFLMMQHFKLQWMVFYFENLGNQTNFRCKAKQIRMALQLLEIVLCKGFDYGSDTLPYVNYTNAHRFQYIKKDVEGFESRKAEVRFRKAYFLYFEMIRTHLMTWI